MIDSVFGINFLLVKGYDKILRNITMVSSIIGFLLAFPLVKYFSAIGVAVVYTFTSALIGVGSMIYACKIKKKKHRILYELKKIIELIRVAESLSILLQTKQRFHLLYHRRRASPCR